MYKAQYSENPEYFPKNLGDVSEGRGERLHQDIRVVEERNHGRYGIAT